MTEANIKEELDREPFRPLRLHLVSGKTIDVVRENTAWPLADRLLVFLNPVSKGVGAEGYDVISYDGIERMEILDIGRRMTPKKKRA